MTKSALTLALALSVTPAIALEPAQEPAQRKECGDLKAEIDAKIAGNGVEVFTTTIVPMDAAEDGTVVGTCDGQTRKILYKRGVAPSTDEMEPAPKQES